VVKTASKKKAAKAAAYPVPTSRIRPAMAADLPSIIALDEEVTGLAKPDYWRDLYDRYGPRRPHECFFLIAETEERIDGFVIGEIRAWEFGSPPCGWIFAIQVRPRRRLQGGGTELFTAICDCFRRAGIDKVRTMLARDNTLILSFFRSQGMMAGPFVELEMPLG
jgi:ribosomal protein S18 acetylase RimI-like enzyme